MLGYHLTLVGLPVGFQSSNLNSQLQRRICRKYKGEFKTAFYTSILHSNVTDIECQTSTQVKVKALQVAFLLILSTQVKIELQGVPK